jgi:hypothetical protein
VGLLSSAKRDQTWWTRWWRRCQGFVGSRLQVDGCPEVTGTLGLEVVGGGAQEVQGAASREE